jgi:hypothetical protein
MSRQWLEILCLLWMVQDQWLRRENISMKLWTLSPHRCERRRSVDIHKLNGIAIIPVRYAVLASTLDRQCSVRLH